MAEKKSAPRPALKPSPKTKTLSKTKVKEIGVDSNGQYDEVKSLSPEYIYSTDQRPENFNNTPFDPLGRPKNDLSPSNPIKPDRPTGASHDESNLDDYKNLGLFREEVRYIFDPANRIEQNKVRKPLATMYEQSRDDTQLSVKKVVRTECKCKDGRVVMGWLDTTTGQKDCSPCRPSTITKPNIYKNYRTKKAKANFVDKKVPLRKQVGVSHFGDVEMKGCQTGNANNNASLEKVNAVSTLNNVVNIDTIDSRGGAKVTAPQNTTGMPFSMYDNDPTNIYGVL